MVQPVPHRQWAACPWVWAPTVVAPRPLGGIDSCSMATTWCSHQTAIRCVVVALGQLSLSRYACKLGMHNCVCGPPAAQLLTSNRSDSELQRNQRQQLQNKQAQARYRCVECGEQQLSANLHQRRYA